MTVSEMPSGISVISVVSDEDGQQTHAFEVLRDGVLVCRADTLPEIAALLAGLNPAAPG